MRQEHKNTPIMVLEPTCKLRWVSRYFNVHGDRIGDNRHHAASQLLLQQWHKDQNGGGEWIDVPIETEKEGT